MEYNREGPALLNWIMTDGQMWVHHHILESKRVNMTRCELGEKGRKEAKVRKLASKLMAIVF